MSSISMVPVGFLAAFSFAATLSAQPNRPDPARYENAIAAYEEADRANPPPQGAVLFIGSSSVLRWRTLESDFSRYQAINRGFGGSVIADSIHFAPRIVLPYRPPVVIFYAGENDISRGDSPEQVAQDFKDFVSLVHAELPETTVAYIAMKPSPRRAHLIEAKRIGNGLIREFSDATPRVHFIDVFSPMLDAEGNPRPELFVADELHLNAEGYVLWEAIIGAYLQGVKG
jgi:lysophospholipase L1-like esterase